MSWPQEGLGQRHGFVLMLAAREFAGMGISDHSPPHVPASGLPLRPVSELVTFDMYGQACVDASSELWLHSMDMEIDSLRSAGRLGTAVDERDGGMYQQNGIILERLTKLMEQCRRRPDYKRGTLGSVQALTFSRLSLRARQLRALVCCLLSRDLLCALSIRSRRLSSKN